MCPETGACAHLAYRAMQCQHGGVRVALRISRGPPMCPEIWACAHLAYREMQCQHGGPRAALRIFQEDLDVS